MGLFSRRRKNGFDPDLWSEADDRAGARGEEPWFDDLSGESSDLEELETNAGVSFDDADASWLADDPGEKVRRQSKR